jgi:hypothetical protein
MLRHEVQDFGGRKLALDYTSQAGQPRFFETQAGKCRLDRFGTALQTLLLRKPEKRRT